MLEMPYFEDTEPHDGELISADERAYLEDLLQYGDFNARVLQNIRHSTIYNPRSNNPNRNEDILRRAVLETVVDSEPHISAKDRYDPAISLGMVLDTFGKDIKIIFNRIDAQRTEQKTNYEHQPARKSHKIRTFKNFLFKNAE